MENERLPSPATRILGWKGSSLWLALVLFLSSCEIISVEQPSSVGQGDVIEIKMNVKDTDVPENPPGRKGIVSVLVPDDWEFVAGTYLGDIENLDGTFELSDRTRDSIQKAIEAPTGMKWISVATADTEFFAVNTPVNFDIRLQLKVGQKMGDFDLGYFIGGEDASYTDEDFSNQWVDTLMNKKISVVAATGIEDVLEDGLPTQMVLEQNYPNPFNPSTTIRYSLAHPAQVELAVFDLAGRRVRVLERGFKGVGVFEVPFDASGLPSGTYLYRLTAGKTTRVQLMVLAK